MSFRPSWFGSLFALVLIAGFITLGQWQLERAASKDKHIASIESAGRAPALPDASQARAGLRVTLLGRFDSDRHTFADNQVHQSRAGVHVYTPFSSNDQTLLVNRGWIALNTDRSNLPEVVTDSEIMEISGRLSKIPGVGRPLGDALEMSRSQWPQLVTYPDIERISSALDEPLFPLVLLLDADSPGGFGGRDWQTVYLSPDKHRAYAFQWFALAIAALSGWVLLSFTNGKTKAQTKL